MKLIRRIGFFVIVMALVLAAAPTDPIQAASFGSITGVCLDGNTLFVTVEALGDEDDGDGTDLLVVIVSSAMLVDSEGGGYSGEVWPRIPADNALHSVTVTFELPDSALSGPAMIAAANVQSDGEDPAMMGFIATVLLERIPACAVEEDEPEEPEGPVPAPVAQPGRGAPRGFKLHHITCSTAVFDRPAGEPVGQNAVYEGQTWYVNPEPDEGSDGEEWTEVFVGGPRTVYIPSECVGAPVH